MHIFIYLLVAIPCAVIIGLALTILFGYLIGDGP